MLAAALIVLASATVTGTVRSGGAPLAGVRVTIGTEDGPQRVITDSHGAFEATLLRAGHATLTACLTGYLFAEEPLELADGRTLRVELTAEPTPPELVVLCGDNPRWVPLQRDTESSMFLPFGPPPFPVGRRVAVHPAKADARPAAFDGLVRSARAPVAGAVVELRFRDELPVHATAVTDAAGRFAFNGLVAAAYDLEVHAPEGVSVSPAQTLIPGQRKPVVLDLEPARDVHLIGTVREANGAPAAGALVYGFVAAADYAESMHPPSVHTASDGSFELHGSRNHLPSIGFEVAASGGRRVDSSRIALELDKPFEVRLDAVDLVRCVGVVVDSAGGAVAGATVFSYWNEDRANAPLGYDVTDARGRFVFTSDSEGYSALSALYRGQSVAGKCPNPVLRLSAGATLRGVRSKAAPAETVHVRVLRGPRKAEGRFDEDGRFPNAIRFSFTGREWVLPNLPVDESLDVYVDDDPPFSVVLPEPAAWELDAPH